MFFARMNVWVLLVLGSAVSVAGEADTLFGSLNERDRSETLDYVAQIQRVGSSLGTEHEFSGVMSQFEKSRHGVKQTEVLPVINTTVWSDYVSQIGPSEDDDQSVAENHSLDEGGVLELQQSREFDVRYSKKAVDYLSQVNSVDW